VSAPPPFAITMGDASGVGPELVLRRAADGTLLGDDVVVFGDAAILRHGAELLGLDVPVAALPLAAGAGHARLPTAGGRLDVVDLGRLTADDHRPGVLDAGAGAAARDYVLAATDAALAGRAAAVVTMPMNKEATQRTDPTFVGHTELIAERCGAASVTMMLTAELDDGPIAVTHVSTHCSLRDAIERARHDRIVDVIRLTQGALEMFVDAPRIAVCGLNPHAGEHGLFGTEDADEIGPAIATARAEGIDASGPHPADTVFFLAVRRRRYDAIVVMYHDQGHAPMKLLAFDTGVNVTLGLPIVRTSVDHGTAFDIAWRGEAFADSLDHALAMARRLTGRTG
jgi:4-hydroxythreonine-4-phosphate dehydrogenase